MGREDEEDLDEKETPALPLCGTRLIGWAALLFTVASVRARSLGPPGIASGRRYLGDNAYPRRERYSRNCCDPVL